MWRLWVFFSVFRITFSAPLDSSTGSLQEGAVSQHSSFLTCLMLPNPLSMCTDIIDSGDNEKVPKRLQSLYQKLVAIKHTIHKDQYAFSFDLIDLLPLSFLYLLPKNRLNDGSKYSVSNILRKLPNDEALTLKLVNTLTDDSAMKYFLRGLSKNDLGDEEDKELPHQARANLSSNVQHTIATVLSQWYLSSYDWQFWHFDNTMASGSPLFAYLPNYFLDNLALDIVSRFLYHLRSHGAYEDTRYENWSEKPQSVKRVWAKMALEKAEPPERWSTKIVNQLGFLLFGATAEELKRLPNHLKSSSSSEQLLNLKDNVLQSRAVFDVFHQNDEELSAKDLKTMSPILMNLLPHQIQKFDVNSSDFGLYRNYDKPWTLPSIKQMVESDIAHNVLKRRLPSVSPESWNDSISSLGKFLHVLPASYLKSYENKTLSPQVLYEIDSNQLTFKQARFLTKSGEVIDFTKPASVMSIKGLLKMLSSKILKELRSNTMPPDVKKHLLKYFPGDNVAATSALLEKVRFEIDNRQNLMYLLDNDNFNQFFNLLGSRDVSFSYSSITEYLGEISEDPKYHYRIRSLPKHILSALLSSFRNELVGTDEKWTWDNLFNSTHYPVLRLFVSGMSCPDIASLEPFDVLPIISYYVREKKELNQVFPKNMQFCCQKAVINYLKHKAWLRNYDMKSKGLLDLVENFEVVAVGGYIWASLEVEIINSTWQKINILREIGKLPLKELLSATGSTKPYELASIYCDTVLTEQLSLEDLNGMGNLIWFLEESDLNRIKPKDFRLFLESLEDTDARTLCVSSESKKAWAALITSAFGKPMTWSASTLKVLNDLMVVFDELDLVAVNKTSWVEAGDVLPSMTHIYDTMEWSGKTKDVTFYEVCHDILPKNEQPGFDRSVKNILRFYLDAAQILLETVRTSIDILKISTDYNAETGYSGARPLFLSWGDMFPEETTTTTTTTPTTTTVSTTSRPTATYRKPTTASTTTTTEEDDDWLIDYNDTDEEDTKESLSSHNSSNSPIITTKVTPSSSTISSIESVETDPIILTRKRRSEEKEEKRKNKKHKKNKDKKIYRSKDEKTLQEKKLELSTNGSRALVVEAMEENKEMVDKLKARSLRKISCDAIRVMGKSASLVITSEDIQKMSKEELEDCTEVLGHLDLDISIKKTIWSRLDHWKTDISLLEVGSLVAAIEEENIQNLNLSLNHKWALENLGVISREVEDTDTLTLVADQFIQQNPDLQSFSVETLVALGRVVCTMDAQWVTRLLLNRPNTFIDSVIVLGNSFECDGHEVWDKCVQTLANVALSEDAFDKSKSWSAEDVNNLGVIVAGLNLAEWLEKGLKPFALTGLTPSAVKCIPPKIFKELTEEQLAHLPSLSVSVVSQAQMSKLSRSQSEILDRVRRQLPDDNLSVSSSHNINAASSTGQHSSLFVILSFLGGYLLTM